MEEELTQAATLNEYNSQDQEEVEGQTSHWVECYSDNGERYFTNTVTGETSWTKPGSDYEQLDQAGLQPVDGVVEPNAADTSVEDEVIAAQDNVPNESSEVTLWLELYDQDLQTMYYFAPQFGEFLLSAVVPLQSAARSQQARVRVTAMRQQKMNEHSEGSNIDKEISRPRDHVEVNDEIHVVAAPS
ncbi:hypothetical protein JG687_00010861, partial [Phytophthora cactorum]